MEILFVKTECALSKTQIELADYVINPYKGCFTGCLYCYARANSQIIKIQKPWGDYLYIKENFLDLLIRGIAAAGKINRVLIGSTTEPFQEMEKQYCLTGSILKILKDNNIPCVILTKSKQVAEYASLLTYSSQNKVYITYNRDVIRQLFEKRSCQQEERLAAAESLVKAGVDTILYISPVFPYLTEMQDLFKRIKGKVNKVYCENYNPKLGNWDELKTKLDSNVIEKIKQIYASAENYNEYWKQFTEKTNRLNTAYEFNMEFFIYPYDSYYSQ